MQDAANENRFIMKLKSNVTFGSVRRLCVEMANLAPGAARFMGSCDTLVAPFVSDVQMFHTSIYRSMVSLSHVVTKSYDPHAEQASTAR